MIQVVVVVVVGGVDRSFVTYQGDDGTLGRQLSGAEERPDEAVDQFVLRVDHGVVVRDFLSLWGRGLVVIGDSAQSER